jgi:hypothetical protein
MMIPVVVDGFFRTLRFWDNCDYLLNDTNHHSQRTAYIRQDIQYFRLLHGFILLKLGSYTFNLRKGPLRQNKIN